MAPSGGDGNDHSRNSTKEIRTSIFWSFTLSSLLTLFHNHDRKSTLTGRRKRNNPQCRTTQYPNFHLPTTTNATMAAPTNRSITVHVPFPRRTRYNNHLNRVAQHRSAFRSNISGVCVDWKQLYTGNNRINASLGQNLRYLRSKADDNGGG